MRRVAVALLAASLFVIAVAPGALAHDSDVDLVAPGPGPVDPVDPAPEPIPVPPAPIIPFAGAVIFLGDVWINGTVFQTGIIFAFTWQEDLTSSRLWALWNGEIIEVCNGHVVEAPRSRPVFIGESSLLGPTGSCYIQEIPGPDPGFVFLIMLEDGQWALGVLRDLIDPVPVVGVL